MNFQTWLKHQAHRPDQVGRLSAETRNDKKWPKAQTRYPPLATYLVKHGASEGAQQTLRLAFLEWALEQTLSPVLAPKSKRNNQ